MYSTPAQLAMRAILELIDLAVALAHLWKKRLRTLRHKSWHDFQNLVYLTERLLLSCISRSVDVWNIATQAVSDEYLCTSFATFTKGMRRW